MVCNNVLAEGRGFVRREEEAIDKKQQCQLDQYEKKHLTAK
jgi:hypothetical protein